MQSLPEVGPRASSAALPSVGGRQHGGYRTRLQRASSAPGTQLALHLQLLSQAARRCVFGGGGAGFARRFYYRFLGLGVLRLRRND